jgi:exosome complex component RRP45
MLCAEVFASSAARAHVLSGLCSSPAVRADGRSLGEARPASVRLRRWDDAVVAEASLGETSVAAVVSASLGAPAADRGAEGSLSFAVFLGGLAPAAPADGGGGGGEAPRERAAASAELARLLERALRDSGAVDLEALCVSPGAAVWRLRVEVHALADGGNLVDAAALAAAAGLAAFRRPDARAGAGGTVRLRRGAPPLALALHHCPVAVTLGLFAAPAARAREAGAGAPAPADFADAVVADPSALEERVADGSLTLIMNAHRELCGVHKLGGCPLAPAVLAAAVAAAGERAQALVAVLRAAVADADRDADAREAARILAAAVGAPPAGVVDAEPPTAAA